MKEYILESLEDGSHGIIPDEGINYFVGHNRITIHKDGKKVLDKVVDVNPDGSIVKYNLCCDDDKDPTLEPIKAKEVDEYNIGNMLPQVVPSGTPLKKQELCNESDDTEDNEFEKDQKDVKEYYDLDVLDERLDNLLEECSDIIDGIMNNTSESTDDTSEDVVITENANDDLIEEGAKESIEKAVKISKSEIDKLCNLAKEKLELFKTLKDEKDNLVKKDIKKKIINNQKKFRDLIKGFPLKNRKAVTKVYGRVNLNTINQINQMEFQRQMEEAIRQHLQFMDTVNRNNQQFMDTVNQNNMINQQMMMNNMMF